MPLFVALGEPSSFDLVGRGEVDHTRRELPMEVSPHVVDNEFHDVVIEEITESAQENFRLESFL